MINKNDIAYHKDVEEQLKALANIASTDCVPKMPLSDTDKHLLGILYTRYSCVIKKLLDVIDGILESAFTRLLDIRKSLGDVSDDFMTEVMSEAGVTLAEAAHMRSLPIHSKRSPQDFSRIEHLVHVFSPHAESLDRLPITSSRSLDIPDHLDQDTLLPAIPLEEPQDESSAPRRPRARKSMMLRSLKDRNAAATKIGAYYRMYRAKRAFVLMRQRELEFFEILPIRSTGISETVDRGKQIMKKRKILQKLAYETFLRDRDVLRAKYQDQTKTTLLQSFVPKVKSSFWEFSEQNGGKFPASLEQLVGLVESGSSLKQDPDADSKKPKKSAPKSSKPNSKKKKVITPPAPTSLDLLRTTLQQMAPPDVIFDVSTYEHLSSEEKARISMNIRKSLISDHIYPDLSKSRPIPMKAATVDTEKENANKNKPTSKPTPPAPPPEKTYEEQDLIDLIKEGFVKIVAGERHCYCSSAVKSKLLEHCVIPALVPGCMQFMKQTFCVHGPPGWGKKSIVNSIASETRSVVFVLSPRLLKSRKETAENLATKIVFVAKNTAPSVILIDGIEEIYPRPEKKKKAQGGLVTEPKPKNPLAKYRPLITLLKDKISGSPILLIVIANSPACNADFFGRRGAFSLKLDVRTTIDRHQLITGVLSQAGVPLEIVYGDLILVETLRRITEHMAPKGIVTAIHQVVTPERAMALKRNTAPLRAADFAEALSKINILVDQNTKEWNLFTDRLNAPMEPAAPPQGRNARIAKK